MLDTSSGNFSNPQLSLPFKNISEWDVVDKNAVGSSDNGLKVKTTGGSTCFFQVPSRQDSS